jgi:PAS domain S-box-containing protein
MEANKICEDESREFAESIINTIREPLIALDHELRVVFASRSFYKFFKVNPEETVGQLIYNLGNKQWNIPKLRELLETILPRKTTFDGYEVEHDFSAIGRRIMLLNARQIRRVWGKERIILLAIEDITAHRQLEILLEDSEKRYRRLFENANDGILLLDKREGNITHANPAITSMLGYSNEEFIGNNLRAIGFPHDMGAIQEILKTLEQNGIIHHKGAPIKKKTGQFVDTDIYMVDKADLVQCNIRDITYRKKVEKSLKESEENYHFLFDNAPDLIISFDAEGNFLDLNKKFEEESGYGREEMIGKSIFTSGILAESSVNIAIPYFEKILAGKKLVLLEVEGVTKEGSKIPYELMAVPIKKEGKVVAIQATLRNITKHRKLEAQLRHSQKMETVGTLVGGIAHDFNNILNVIMGYGVMVKDTLAAGSPAMGDMNEVLTAADRAADLTKRLLVFSRKKIVEVSSVNINALILDLKKLLIRIIRENIEFNLDLADRPLTVLADVGQIEHVLINLAANARDAMLEGGQLTIGTGIEEMDEASVAAYGYGKPGRYVLITVADTGRGIDAETQKKIFEPFFTTKGIGEGTGLGLAISYGIIKQHDGYIKVHSEPGQGTIFTIYLPFYEGTASPDKKPETAASVRGGNETVLVAEDDAATRKLTRTVLESFGYSVVSAKDGEEAITKFMENRERISLVLLDMIMPKKSGKEVSEAIIKIEPRMKVLFASGYAMDKITNKELKESGFEFIHKPFRPKDLLIKVRDFLDR